MLVLIRLKMQLVQLLKLEWRMVPHLTFDDILEHHRVPNALAVWWYISKTALRGQLAL